MHMLLHFVAYCRRAVFKVFNNVCNSERVRARASNAFFSFVCSLSLRFFHSSLCCALTRNLTQINENNKNDSQNNNNFNQCVRVCERVFEHVFVNKCTSQFASKRASLCTVRMHTEHKVFQYKYWVLKGITSTLLCVLHSYRWSHALMKKSKRKKRTNKWKQQSTHQSIISLWLKQINENAIATYKELDSTSSDDNKTICRLIWNSSAAANENNNNSAQQTTKCRQEIPLKVDNVIWLCVSAAFLFVSFALLAIRHTAKLFIHNAPHDLFSDFSRRIFVRINFNWEYPHFS